MTVRIESRPVVSTLLSQAQPVPMNLPRSSDHFWEGESHLFEDCVLLHCILTGEPLLDLIVLHFIADEDFRVSTLDRLRWNFKDGECRFFGGAYLPIVLEDVCQALHESCDRLLANGLIQKGIPELPAADASILDFWYSPRIEFFEDSLSLSEQGKQHYLHLESRLFQREIWVTRRVDNLKCMMTSSPHIHPWAVNDCSNLNPIYGLQCPLLQGNPQELCRMAYIPQWRADWWRSPEPGYLWICSQVHEDELAAVR